MHIKSKLALATAAGVLSLYSVAAIAQQPATPPAEKPAAEAPAAAGNSATASDSAKSNEATKAETGKSDRADRRSWRQHRRHSRYGRGYERHRGMGRRNAWRNMSQEDRKAYFEARLAAVYAGLMLNETQTKLWPNVEAAVREMVSKRRAWAERIKKEGRPANPFDRMKRRADMMVDRGAAMQKFADAAKPLYDTLSDGQKRRLKVLTRGVRKMARAHAMRRHRMMMRNMHGQRRSYHHRHHSNR